MTQAPMKNIKHIVESLLFVSETPLTINQIQKALVDAESSEIRDALNSLSNEYGARKGGFYLNEVAGGYQLRTRAEYTEWIKRLLQSKPSRMSKAALETLAIIAYKQPVIRSDIEHIRGVDSGGVLRMLLERKLIRILGRRKIPGRPLIYATTKMFLEMFDLKDLKELPTPKEIEALEEEADPADEQTDGETDPNQMQLFETEPATDNINSGDGDTEETPVDGISKDDPGPAAHEAAGEDGADPGKNDADSGNS